MKEHLLYAVLLAVLSALYFAVLLPKYVRMPSNTALRKRRKVKLSMSGCFCLLGAAGCAVAPSVFSALVTAGLIFGFIGDYFLLYITADRRRFRIGVAAFALTQLIYIAAMLYVTGGLKVPELGIFTILMIAVGFMSVWAKPKLGKGRALLLVYLLLVTFMGAKAITMLLAHPGPAWVLFGAGGLLFYLSDIVLAWWKCVRRSSYARGLNSFLYFTGQYLIALSLLFL